MKKCEKYILIHVQNMFWRDSLCKNEQIKNVKKSIFMNVQFVLDETPVYLRNIFLQPK